MSKIKDFTAEEFSGIAGFLIIVKGQVNCGMLEVQPTLTENEPQGPNPTILLLTAYPASDAMPESFREATFTKNLNSKSQYKEVQIMDSEGNSLKTIPVTTGKKQAE